MLGITEVGFMLRATSKWRRRRSGQQVSELLVHGGWTVGQSSALHFTNSFGKPRAITAPWWERTSSPIPAGGQSHRQPKRPVRRAFVLSKRQGVVRAWLTIGFPGFILPLCAWRCSLRWRRHSLLFPSLSCLPPFPKYTITGSLPSPAPSPCSNSTSLQEKGLARISWGQPVNRRGGGDAIWHIGVWEGALHELLLSPELSLI